MYAVRLVLLVLFYTLLVPSSSGVCANAKAPDEWAQKTRKEASLKTSAPTIVFTWVIRFFQAYISPMDGPRCQLYPTCSGYGKEAFSRNGALLGYIMTADRLMRDNSGAYLHYPLVRVGKHYYYADPVSDNERLFSHSSSHDKNKL